MKKKSDSGFVRRMFVFVFVPPLVFLWAGPVFAGIFKWVDENGKTHYTNNQAKIPRKYRQSNKVEKLRSMRGVTETPEVAEKVGEPPAVVPEEELTVDSKIEAPAPGDAVASLADQVPQIDAKTQAKMDQISKVVDYLKSDNIRLEQLLKEHKEQTRVGGEYIAWSNKHEAGRSKTLAEEMYDAGYPELEEAAGHLWSRAEEAEGLQIDKSENFKELVPELYQEARKHLDEQKKFIKEMERVLKDLGDGQTG